MLKPRAIYIEQDTEDTTYVVEWSTSDGPDGQHRITANTLKDARDTAKLLTTRLNVITKLSVITETTMGTYHPRTNENA